MRITCPNCNAHYEISEELIPAEGREVQCSNCSKTWFQEGRRAVEETAQDRAAEEDDPEDEDDDPEDEGSEGGPADALPRRPIADERTLAILREERAYEERRRAIERQSSPPPTPPDPHNPREAAAREAARMAAAASVARARSGTEVVSPGDTPSDPQREADPRPEAGPNRRNLLPDIEKINKSLRPDEPDVETVLAEEEAELDRRSGPKGFRIGFLTVLALIAVATMAYLFADQIVDTLPVLDQAMSGYVSAVDRGRISLEARAESILAIIGPDA
ncbi:MAG: zinc-ribbon domain-containing protein [Pseudomonadota bacterium]